MENGLVSRRKWYYRVSVGILGDKPEIVGPITAIEGYDIAHSPIFDDGRFFGTNYRWHGPLQTIEP